MKLNRMKIVAVGRIKVAGEKRNHDLQKAAFDPSFTLGSINTHGGPLPWKVVWQPQEQLDTVPTAKMGGGEGNYVEMWTKEKAA